MDRAQKEQQVNYIAETFEKAKSVIFANYRGLNVSAITDLRRRLSGSKSDLKVVKNRLAKRAASKAKIEGLEGFFVGPTAMASSSVDPILPAKVMVDFAKDHEVLEIKAGYMDGKVLSLATIRELARLPSREVLLSRVLGSMNAPITNLTRVLAAIPRQLVTVVNAIKEKKDK